MAVDWTVNELPKIFLEIKNPAIKSLIKKWNKGAEEGDPIKYIEGSEKEMMIDVLGFLEKDLAKIHEKKSKTTQCLTFQ